MRNIFILIILSIMLKSQSSFAQTTLTIGPGAHWADVLIQSTATTNQALAPHFAAYAWTESGTPAYKRSLLKFNLSAIPAGSTIQSAKLYLYSDPTVTGSVAWNGNSQYSGSNAVYFEKITSNWSETSVIWNNQPPTTTTGRIWFPGSTSTTENIQVNLTSFVQSWINNPSTNYGLKMRLENEAYYRSRTYASEEHSNTNIRPRLVITYTAPLVVADLDCDVSIDSAAAVSQPYFNNNQFLLDLVQEIEGGSTIARTTTGGLSSAVFKIPVKAWIYGNSSGTYSITTAEAEQYINEVNRIFNSNNVSIMFYLSSCGINRIQDDDWFIGENWNSMWNTNYQENMLNIHFIQTSDVSKARLPIAATKPYKCWVITNGSYSSGAANTLAHEIGHTLGLVHTHDNARDPFSSRNGNAFGCYQEYVDREATLSQWNGCLDMGGYKRCEVNGDMLCDTDADPKLREGTTTNRVDSSCNFLRNDPDEDYRVDNDGQPWLPAGNDNALNNIMSYSDRWNCRREFTPMQRGVMYYYARYHLNLALYPANNDPQFYQNDLIDQFENDNFWVNANTSAINEIQNHTIHPSTYNSTTSCDEDWVRFQISTTKTYEIQTRPVLYAPDVNTVIELYHINRTPDGAGGFIESLGSHISSNDDGGDGSYSKITRSLSQGQYAIKIKGYNSSSKGYYSIEVSDECYELTNSGYSISGDPSLCDYNSEIYSVPSSSNDYTYNWSVGPGLQIQSGANTNQIYVKQSSYSGSSTIDLTITSPSGCSYTVPTKQVNVYYYSSVWSGSITGPSTVCVYSYDYYSVDPYHFEASPPVYSWTLSKNPDPTPLYGYLYGGGGTGVYLKDLPTTGTYTITVSTTSPCDLTLSKSFQLEVIDDSNCSSGTYSTAGSYNYYPNPPDGELTVSLKDDEPISDSGDYAEVQDNEFEVKLINNKGETVRTKKSKKERSLKIKTEDLPNGLYYLHIMDKKGIVKKQILIEH